MLKRLIKLFRPKHRWQYLGTAYKRDYKVSTYQCEITGEINYKYEEY